MKEATGELNSTIVVHFKIDDSTKSDGQETNVVKFNWLFH